MTDLESDWVPTGLYKAVLDTREELHRLHPDGVDIHVHGLTAWSRLSPAEKREWLPHALGAYVTRVHDEEHMRQLDQEARDLTHTYLQDYEIAVGWDAVMSTPDQYDQVLMDRDALMNVLSELELLQHRLRVRDAENNTTEGQ